MDWQTESNISKNTIIYLNNERGLTTPFFISYNIYNHMKKILLLLLVLPTIVFAQTRDSVYVKNEIFEIVYSEILQQPKKVTYEVQCPNGSASRKGMDFYRVQGVYTSDALDYEKNEWD